MIAKTTLLLGFIGVLKNVLWNNKGEIAMSVIPFGRVIQSGGRILTTSTLKILNLSKRQGRDAIHAMKRDLGLPNDFHGKITDTGNYLDPSTNEVLGNIFDYIY